MTEQLFTLLYVALALLTLWMLLDDMRLTGRMQEHPIIAVLVSTLLALAWPVFLARALLGLSGIPTKKEEKPK